ncbi:hypothetical protein JOF53_004981 [Crossiella equi]|uniref:DUF4878 domain-containing protein n=1 Tax=Crossiella equi TaxID=130796 RepID=A0ABS5AIR8_9PSEU|nr:hypothetical protein [Crossiella equi]MBP2476109.1 hypothetical protein [Crossiella equi]
MDRRDEPGSGDKRELELRKIEDRIVERLEKRLPKQRTWRTRLIKYGVIAAVLVVAYFYFFSCDSSPLRGGGGTDGNGNATQVLPRTSTTPQDQVRVVFAAVSNEDARRGCTAFSPEAATKFAANLGAQDCLTALADLAKQVTNKTAYKNVRITSDQALTSGDNSEVSSCRLELTGGPRLGLFILQKQADGGWLITGHEKEPADCLTG